MIEKARIGQIKEFENGVVGLISGMQNNKYTVITKDGDRVSVPTSFMYKEPKLPERERKTLEDLSSCLWEIAGVNTKLSELDEQRKELQNKHKELTSKFGDLEASLRKEKGLFTKDDFYGVLYQSFSDEVRKKIFKDNPYRMKIEVDEYDRVNIIFIEERILKEKVSKEDYPFIKERNSSYNGKVVYYADKGHRAYQLLLDKLIRNSSFIFSTDIQYLRDTCFFFVAEKSESNLRVEYGELIYERKYKLHLAECKLTKDNAIAIARSIH